MSTQPAPTHDAATPPDSEPAEATPLTPAHVGHAIGDDADPEQDVAPNLGGEEQMQDA